MSDTLQVLIKARELVARPGGWCRLVSRNGDAYCAWKAIGVVARAINASTLVARKLFRCVNGIDDIVFWNDAPGRTQAEVVAAFDRAIEAARKERA